MEGESDVLSTKTLSLIFSLSFLMVKSVYGSLLNFFDRFSCRTIDIDDAEPAVDCVDGVLVIGDLPGKGKLIFLAIGNDPFCVFKISIVFRMQTARLDFELFRGAYKPFHIADTRYGRLDNDQDHIDAA